MRRGRSSTTRSRRRCCGRDPGAIRYDAPAAANRPGRHGLWQRPLERRRLAAAPLLVPVAPGTLAETPQPHAEALVVPIPSSRRPAARARPRPFPRLRVRDIAAITYAANPEKKGLDHVLAGWKAHREGEELVVAGTDLPIDAPGVRSVGHLEPEEYRALLRRARVFICAPRREDYGIAQLEALADGCVLITTAAPGPYAALPLARALNAGVRRDASRRARRRAAHRPRRPACPTTPSARPSCSRRIRRAAVDAVVRDELLPRLLR